MGTTAKHAKEPNPTDTWKTTEARSQAANATGALRASPVIAAADVRARAFEIFQARTRMGGPGDEASDWLQAEHELCGGRAPGPSELRNDHAGVPGDPAAGTNAVASHIEGLSDSDGLVRERARRALVALGSASVEPLIRALTDPEDQLRWEAAKALSAIRDAASAPALVTALEDDLFGVRWLAAEGLTSLERDGLKALLPALIHRADCIALRHGALHILHALSKRGWRTVATPVVVALESAEASLAVPLAAHRAMLELEH